MSFVFENRFSFFLVVTRETSRSEHCPQGLGDGGEKTCRGHLCKTFAVVASGRANRDKEGEIRMHVNVLLG